MYTLTCMSMRICVFACAYVYAPTCVALSLYGGEFAHYCVCLSACGFACVRACAYFFVLRHDLHRVSEKNC